MNLAEARDHLAELLDAAGIRAVTEPRKILLPCALVEVPSTVRSVSMNGSGCSATVDIAVTLIATSADPDWLLATVVDAMSAVGCIEATSTLYSMGDDAQLPAYSLPVVITVKET